MAEALFSRTLGRRRRWVLAALGGLGAVLLAAGTAWACTPQQGPTTLTTGTTYDQGDTISAYATGVDTAAGSSDWRLYLSDDRNVSCMDGRSISGTVQQSGGNIGSAASPISGTVPNNADVSEFPNDASVCFRTVGHQNGFASFSALFTII